MTCDTCRRNHYRCDDGRPTCGRCARTGRPCVRTRKHRFKHTGVSGASHTWLQVPPELRFVDPGEDVDESDEAGGETEDGTPSTTTASSHLFGSLHDDSGTVIESFGSDGSPATGIGYPSVSAYAPTEADEAAGEADDVALSTTTASVHLFGNLQEEAGTVVESLGSDGSPATGMGVQSIFTFGSTDAALSWPINDEQSAMLVRHFILTVAQFFDFCDEQRHFARVVPVRARSDSTLANAMLACSARHLSLTTTFDHTVADAYYQQCLEALIPAIATRVDDETLLAATVILRFMEELELPMTGRDSQHHLLGTQALVQAYEQQFHSETPSSSLLDAAKLAAFRQDMYMALTAQRPMNLSKRGMFPYQGHLSQAISETDWANFAIVHCCDTLEFAFAEGPQNVDDYHELRTANDEWRRNKPASFEPFFSASGPELALPDVRYMADWHSMGNLYNLLARLLLLTHDPELPRLGLARRIAIKTADDNIRTTLLSMAGIAKSNCDTCSSLLVASMAIAMFGDRLTVGAEQDVVDQILGETQARCGWPTTAARQMLRTAWQLS